MNLKIKLFLGGAAFFGTLISVPYSGAQQKQTPAPQANVAYDIRREVTLLGTVVSYTAESTVAPLGAHVTIQTSAGNVDVHLGSSQLIEHRHLNLTAGDSVRIIGETLSSEGTAFFAARIIQKGTQAVAVRNTKGYPMDVMAVHVVGGVR